MDQLAPALDPINCRLYTIAYNYITIYLKNDLLFKTADKQLQVSNVAFSCWIN